MDAIEKGQVSRTAAEVYDEFFVPALFQEWAARVADAAHIQPGQRVLDVACGTGVLTCTAAERVGASGSVVGVDVNEGMLAVAARKAPPLEWRQGKAEALPFDSDSFDVVVSQFGLMFFDDRRTTIREMVRVLRPGGRLAVAVWGSLADSPGYSAVVKLLQRLFGEEAANALRAPFILGDVRELQALFDGTGLSQLEVRTSEGTARFPSLESWMFTEIKGWTLADMLDDAQYALLLKEANSALSQFVTDEGTVAFNETAHILTAVKG